jgi:hypothetical protein
MRLDSTDAALSPKIYHAIEVMKHFKGWEPQEDLAALSR